MLIRYTASGWNSGPVTGAGIGGGALVGFESKISTVLPGWWRCRRWCSPGTLNTNRSVISRRRSSPGNFRLSALKWLDMMTRLLAGCGVPRSLATQEAEQRGVDMVAVGPGDGVRAAPYQEYQHGADQ